MLFIPFPDNSFIILSQTHTHTQIIFLAITVIIYEKSNIYGKFMRK